MTATLRDQLASDAHQAWMDENARNGFTTRISSLTGEEQMVPFDQLSDAVKAYDYALVDVILASLEKRGYAVIRRGLIRGDGGERFRLTDDGKRVAGRKP